jgi:hypothetical protein
MKVKSKGDISIFSLVVKLTGRFCHRNGLLSARGAKGFQNVNDLVAALNLIGEIYINPFGQHSQNRRIVDPQRAMAMVLGYIYIYGLNVTWEKRGDEHRLDISSHSTEPCPLTQSQT